MKKFILDFEFNETTGSTNLTIDFQDPSLTSFEINESIKSGELLENVIDKAREIFGDDIADKVTSGELKAICLDNHPELKSNEGGILLNSESGEKEKLNQ